MSEELTFPISISKLPPVSEKISLTVDQTTNELLAEACAITAVNNLQTSFRFKRWRKHGVTIFCDFSAEIEQECIATLEPVNTRLKASFERQFLPERSSEYTMPEIIDGEMVLDPEASDIPDIIEGDIINLWDVLIEEMILVIDPFPRATGLEERTPISEVVEPDIHAEPTHKPFSNLKSLITEKKSNK